MTNIEKLTVSLTKHGAHKVARLLLHFEPELVLKNTKYHDIDIDAAMVAKILSVTANGKVPKIWELAKNIGPLAINQLVMIGIIFSHHELITAFQKGARGFGKGVILGVMIPNNKAYSNIKNNVVELGFALSANSREFSYDFSSMFSDKLLAPLVSELLRLKLSSAQWSEGTEFLDECIACGFHEVLAISETEFRRWLTKELIAEPFPSADDIDELPETEDPDVEKTKEFKFRIGHNHRQEGHLPRKPSGKTPVARLIHNQLQNKLYNKLVNVYGFENIGTEVSTGVGDTLIDIVRQDKHGFIFYELKTSLSLKKCIREALPQLLEYAYWKGGSRAYELIIVSERKPTKDAQRYLNFLRETHKLPIFHETFDMKTGDLHSRI